MPYEFGPARDPSDVSWGASGTHRQPPGTWSDDGGLLLALLDSLLTVGFDIADQAARSLAWLDGPDYKPGGTLFDVGMTTSAALARVRSGVAPQDAGGRTERDNGNGSLMRILPVALVERGSPAELIERAEQASALTHAHARARLVCALYCLIARKLLEGHTDRSSALETARDLLFAARAQEFGAELELIAAYAKRTGSGYVVDTFWSAWDAFNSSSSFEECVRKAVAYGNDTDTTACVAGGLAGLYWGIDGIPADWLAGMRGHDLADPLVARLIDQAPSSTG